MIVELYSIYQTHVFEKVGVVVVVVKRYDTKPTAEAALWPLSSIVTISLPPPRHRRGLHPPLNGITDTRAVLRERERESKDESRDRGMTLASPGRSLSGIDIQPRRSALTPMNKAPAFITPPLSAAIQTTEYKKKNFSILIQAKWTTAAYSLNFYFSKLRFFFLVFLFVYLLNFSR